MGLLWIAKFALPAALAGGGVYGMIAGVAGGVVVLAWWLLFKIGRAHV